MSDIFLSYDSADRDRARGIAARLEQEGWSVWWDRKIPPGQRFDKVLKAELDGARCVVVLWSRESVESEWVQNEASEGNRRGILVPGCIDDILPPFEFQRIQAANLVGWEDQLPGSEFEALLAAISRVLGRKRVPHPIPPAQSPPALIWHRWGRLGVIVVIVFLFFAALFKVLYPHTSIAQAPFVLVILSMIVGGGLNFGWVRWRRSRVRKLRRKE